MKEEELLLEGGNPQISLIEAKHLERVLEGGLKVVTHQKPSKEIAFDFSIMSYNILAQSYIRPNQYQVSPTHLDFYNRSRMIVDFVAYNKRDIYCFQEVEEDLKSLIINKLYTISKYDYYHTLKNERPEGLMIIWNTEKFYLMQKNKLVLGKNCAICLKLRWNQNPSNELWIVTIHAEGNPKLEDVQLAEVNDVIQYLVDNDAKTAIFCGDFNATTDSSTYKHLWNSEGANKLGFSSLYSTVWGNEPEVTFHTGFISKTVDYIFYTSKTLFPTNVMVVQKKEQGLKPMPNDDFGSDHLAIGGYFCWKK